MNNQSFNSSVKGHYDDDLDHAIAEAIDHFAKFNIRFRAPNRNIGPTHQQKYFKEEGKYK